MTRLRDLPALRSGKLDCFYVDPREIIVDPEYNCRDMNSAETKAHIVWLADCIEREGFSPEQPVTLRRRGDDLVMVRGHCRHAACLLVIKRGNELGSIPFMQIGAGSSEADLLFDQQTSNSGLPLDQFAKARIVRKAKRMGIPDAEIIRRMQWKSVKSIKDHLDYLELPEEAQQMVSKGEVAATTAVAEVKANGAEKAVQRLRTAKQAATDAGSNKVMPKHFEPEPKEEPKLPPINVVTTAPIERPGPEDIEPVARKPLLHPSPEGAKAVDWSFQASGPGRDTAASAMIPRGQIADLINATLPIFDAIRLSDLVEYEDDDTVTIQVSARQAKAFDAQVAKITGGADQ